MSVRPRVLGFDPGTITTDLCVLEGGRLAYAGCLPSIEIASAPDALLRALERLGDFDLVAAPSGYGLPLLGGDRIDERALRLAFLAPPDVPSGILGLRRAVAALVAAGLPLVFLPGVVQLVTVPAHRKVNRVDMGTADKVSAAAAALAEQAARRGIPAAEASLILLELGGAFTAALAVEGGAIVDGVGGSSGPLGFRAAGALDGEAAALAGTFPKDALFTGGAAWVAGDPGLDPRAWGAALSESGASASALSEPRPPGPAVALEAYLEGAVKAVAALLTTAPSAREVVLSGRLARLEVVAGELERRLGRLAPGLGIRPAGWAATVLDRVPGATGGAGPLESALGAALLADGLCGGAHASLVEALRLREAAGSVLDHLYLPVARAGAERFRASLE